MIRKVTSILLIASVSFCMTGCFSGRTSLTASHYASKPYDIYLNGYHVCKMGSDDDCSFQTRGTRAGGILEAQLDGQVVGSTNIHREITMLSILFTPVTYAMSIWLYRAYPDEIEIPIDPYIIKDIDNGSKNTVSVWDRPYNVSTKSKKKAQSVEESIDESAPQAVRDGATAGTDVETGDEPTPVKKSVWD
jgi:hypothetical protein